MPRVITLKVHYDPETSWHSDEHGIDGVLSGYVFLKMRSIVVIDFIPHGVNNSIISLLRSCFCDHESTKPGHDLDTGWPMFFCNGSMSNKCGVISDFSVTHKSNKITFSNFFGCVCQPETIIMVPWLSWANEVEKAATVALRKLPKTKNGMEQVKLKQYQALRKEHHDLLIKLRKLMRNKPIAARWAAPA